MPERGSNRLDRELHRRQSQLENRGIRDEAAERGARRSLRGEKSGTGRSSQSDRAGGPLGARGRGGDPGDVIDLRSPSFSANTTIPRRHTQVDANTSPPLEWSKAPDGTAELALACVDPDAPGGTFTHWLVTGIDADTTAVAEGSTPEGAVVWTNDFGDQAYDGPMPSAGDDAHRYVFRLFALEEPLDVPPGVPVEVVREALEEDPLATGTLVGVFGR